MGLANNDQPLYRPPSEGRNLIIQATVGCSFNRCTFCSMYKRKAFRPRQMADVFADGDALFLPTDELAAILDRLAAAFPRLKRVSLYATPINLNRKSEGELRLLRSKGLTLAYLGVESGSADILGRVRKGALPETVIAGLNRAHAAGIAVSATVILGLGGRRLWRERIDGTIAVINAAPLAYLSTLQLRLDAGTIGDFATRFARDASVFVEQDDDGIIGEQKRLIGGVAPVLPVIFRSNHASNCLPLAGTLPQDRDRLLAAIAMACQGAPVMRPASLRGL